MLTALHWALLSALVLGLRHGFDYDHIAAISDIASMQTSTRRAMGLGMFYALGHGATVASLGTAVVLFQLSLPHSIDRWAERLVGATLVLLACYVLGSIARGHTQLPPSRAALMVSSYYWLERKLGLGSADTATQPDFWNSRGRSSAFAVGVVHGLGAETPSQLLLFLLAANLGGVIKGFLGLGMFLVGLLMMNTIMTASAAGIFRAGKDRSWLLRSVATITAAYSFIVGVIFLTGSAPLLPHL